MTLPNRQNLSYAGADWIGDAPKDWDRKRLKYCVTLRDERIDGESSDKPFIGLEHIESWTGRLLTDEESSSSGIVSVFKAGDILLGKLRPYLAKVYEARKDGVSSTEALVMVPGDNLLPRYLFYWLVNPLAIENINSSTYGAKMPRANWEFVGNQMQLLPTVEEQRIISRFLDQETERIDALIGKKRQLLGLLEEKRLAIITQAVTKGLDPTASTKDSGIDWLGEIPAHWSVQPLSSVSKRITYGFTNPMPVDEDGPFMLTANDVGYGKIFFETARRTSQEAFDKELTDKSRPKRDDLLVTKDGTLGRVSIFNGEASCINQSVALVRLDKEKLLPFFALFCLISPPYQEMMLFDARGTTIKHIYITRLSKMPLAFPEPREQLKVVEHLKDKIHQVSSIEKKTADAIEKLKEYRSALITNAVTGKIDVENEASREQTQ